MKKVIQMRVYDINWDCNKGEKADLPNEVRVEVERGREDEAIDAASNIVGFLINEAMTEVLEDPSVIVDLRSVRIQVPNADIVEEFYKGNTRCQAQVYFLLEEKLKEIMAEKFIGDGLIENMEVEDE